ncbi:MAG: hypothetical protein ACKJSK_14570 [Roseibacillus sp.]
MLSAEEIARTWTNNGGKSVTGVLKEKGEGWVKILIKSRIHRIEVDTLSDEDQEYIRSAKIYRTLRMRVTTVKAQPSNAEQGRDIRKVKVALENVQERKLKFRQVWIAQTPGRQTYGVHRVVDVDYDQDGEYFHQEIFYSRTSNGAQDKGFAARLINEDGNTLAEATSMRPFVRFLEESRPAGSTAGAEGVRRPPASPSAAWPASHQSGCGAGVVGGLPPN